MKLNRIYSIFAIALAAASFVGCNNEDPGATAFENKVYLDLKAPAYTTLIKPSTADFTVDIVASMPKPMDKQVDLTFAADMSRVANYNELYLADAVELPADNFEMSGAEAIIAVGSVESTAAQVTMKNIPALDREVLYVLPITLESATNIQMLQSRRVVYYVFKGAALINVVGDTCENNFSVNWTTPDPLKNLTQATFEGLVYARNFDRMISTFMGVEGYYLFRFGDAGFPAGQLQIATSSGNVPSGDPSKELPVGEWVHLAIVHDFASGDFTVYVNGEVQTTGNKQLGSITLGGRSDFYIGMSYSADRYWDGMMSEVRIWNKLRTQDEIKANFYEVDPESDGLVTYWKFDEGAGNIVKDHTANANHLSAANLMKWVPVSLPL